MTSKTQGLKGLKELSDRLGGNYALALRVKKAAERVEEEARMSGLKFKEAGTDEHQKFVDELWKELEPRIREIIDRWGLEHPKAPQITAGDLVKGGHDLKIPVGSRQSEQKQLRAADPIGDFMIGCGMNVTGKVSKKERKARNPISAMLTGITWRQ